MYIRASQLNLPNKTRGGVGALCVHEHRKQMLGIGFGGAIKGKKEIKSFRVRN